MGGVPRRIAGTNPVGMTHLCRARALACPVVAGAILIACKGAAVALRAGQNVMLIGRIAKALHQVAALVQRRLFEEIATLLRLLQRVAMQFVMIGGNDGTSGIAPRSVADAIPRIDGWLSWSCLRA